MKQNLLFFDPSYIMNFIISNFFTIPVKEATLYDKLNGRVICTACSRYCSLKDGQTGFCGIRKNIGGKLYLLSWGLSTSMNIDPIEKKPLFHFKPGSKVLSISTTGCNWMCKYCQNYDISQRRTVEGYSLSPDDARIILKKYRADGASYTYNEPTIFAEYAKDIAEEIRKVNGFNTFVSNGYMSREAVEYVSSFLDAITVDFKGNANDFFAKKYINIKSYDPVFSALKLLKEKGIHIELTDLVVPVEGIGDNLEDVGLLVSWIKSNLGEKTPIHFTRFHPDYLMNDIPPTPISVLENHYRVAKEEGLEFVYLGNVPGNKLENTYCPRCGRLVIERNGFSVTKKFYDDSGHCLFCGEDLHIIT